mmetsp:Transcript_96214/g.200994  ORF Transcript_96214/g.200994 Transcript_96214/m.200994 type:complete len:266 (+) Transcript_96214:745-1542(+)
MVFHCLAWSLASASWWESSDASVFSLSRASAWAWGAFEGSVKRSWSLEDAVLASIVCCHNCCLASRNWRCSSVVWTSRLCKILVTVATELLREISSSTLGKLRSGGSLKSSCRSVGPNSNRRPSVSWREHDAELEAHPTSITGAGSIGGGAGGGPAAPGGAASSSGSIDFVLLALRFELWGVRVSDPEVAIDLETASFAHAAFLRLATSCTSSSSGIGTGTASFVKTLCFNSSRSPFPLTMNFEFNSSSTSRLTVSCSERGLKQE